MKINWQAFDDTMELQVKKEPIASVDTYGNVFVEDLTFALVNTELDNVQKNCKSLFSDVTLTFQ